ncbi:replication-associated recombination protein A [Haloplasma contractile]|uniref:Chromosome segregation helicase protein n=1 Tax=Haloplasma contractile SSD-17B TaxID=1033810 RepID=U2DZU3_9MOLU|nr:replication-associated recombination protein A [Haloplasma contractile]ERJ13707.1 Chromosome segregation helicase protein [Haloplasma contractile SSD-17B]
MKPLAHRNRPKTLDEIVGQEHIVGQNKLINNIINKKQLFSFIFFGPPGVGKTSIAYVIANQLDIPFAKFNAATDNKKRLTSIIETAKLSENYIVIIDEIHRLTKNIQDVLLPVLEDGTIYIIGMTTVSPYYSVNPAIRSRCHVIELKPLNKNDVTNKLNQIVNEASDYEVSDEALELIVNIANGDLRSAINILELTFISDEQNITADTIRNLYANSSFTIDKNSDGHYDTLSAFQKSIRGSDVNASLHYFARLIIADDLESICRRLLVIAYEDISLANPEACARAVHAVNASRQIGLPEARPILVNTVIELALSPKSRSAHIAVDEAIHDVKSGKIGDIPELIKYNPINPPFDYSAADPNKWKWTYLPEELVDKEYYKPQENVNTYEKYFVKYYKFLKTKGKSD